MKKNVFTLSALALAAIATTGCLGKKDVVKEDFEQPCEFVAGVLAPEWYCTPEIEGGFAAVGEAKPNAARDNNMQRTMALANGRDALARDIEVKVQNMLTNWARATGEDETQTYESNFENVSRQVSQQTLQGSRQLKRWLAPDGTLVLLVGITNNDPIKNTLKTSLRNEQALWQQFQSKQALQELDKQMSAAFD